VLRKIFAGVLRLRSTNGWASDNRAALGFFSSRLCAHKALGCRVLAIFPEAHFSNLHISRKVSSRLVTYPRKWLSFAESKAGSARRRAQRYPTSEKGDDQNKEPDDDQATSASPHALAKVFEAHLSPVSARFAPSCARQHAAERVLEMALPLVPPFRPIDPSGPS